MRVGSLAAFVSVPSCDYCSFFSVFRKSLFSLICPNTVFGLCHLSLRITKRDLTVYKMTAMWQSAADCHVFAQISNIIEQKSNCKMLRGCLKTDWLSEMLQSMLHHSTSRLQNYLRTVTRRSTSGGLASHSQT